MSFLRWLKELFLGPPEKEMKTSNDILKAQEWAGQTKDFWIGKCNELIKLGHGKEEIRKAGLDAGLSHAEIESVFTVAEWPRQPFGGHNKADVVAQAQTHVNNGASKADLEAMGKQLNFTDEEIASIVADVKFPAPPVSVEQPVKKGRPKKEETKPAPAKKKK